VGSIPIARSNVAIPLISFIYVCEVIAAERFFLPLVTNPVDERLEWRARRRDAIRFEARAV